MMVHLFDPRDEARLLTRGLTILPLPAASTHEDND